MSRKRGQKVKGKRLNKDEARQKFMDDLYKRPDQFCDYDGNTGKGQLPFKKRCENLYKLIRGRKSAGIQYHVLCERVVKKLVADGLVVVERSKFGMRRGLTKVVAKEYEDVEVVDNRVEPFSKRNAELEEANLRFRGMNRGKERKQKKTIKWTEEKHQQLLLDAIMGTADEDVVKQVTRTKTRPKKIIK